MNKSELVSAIAEKTGLKKVDIEAIIAAGVDVVEETVAKGEDVALVGFGTFKLTTRAARKGINPLTKKAIDIPEKKAPVFKAGKSFKDKCEVKKPAKKAAAKKTTKKK